LSSRAKARENLALHTRALLHILNKSPFRKRQAAVVGHDQVIEHTDVHQLQRLAQAPRDELIGMAGFGDAGRVVVRVMCP